MQKYPDMEKQTWKETWFINLLTEMLRNCLIPVFYTLFENTSDST